MKNDLDDLDDPPAPELPTNTKVYFDDKGKPVAVTQAHDPAVEQFEAQDADAQGRLTLRDIFDLLLCGAQDDHDTAARAAMLGYILKSERAPQSLDELGLRLGISKQAAHKRLTTFRRKCAEILAF